MSYIRRPYSTPDPEYPVSPPQGTRTTYMFRPPSFRRVVCLGFLGMFSLLAGAAGIGRCATVFQLGNASHLTNDQVIWALAMALLGPLVAFFCFFLAKRLSRNAWNYKKAEAQLYYGRRPL